MLLSCELLIQPTQSWHRFIHHLAYELRRSRWSGRVKTRWVGIGLDDLSLFLQLPGEWVLVTAAAGGVGIAAVQLAKGVPCDATLQPINEYNPISIALGAKVIAAAGSETKLDIAKRYAGADYTVNYSNAGWQKEVLKLTNGKGVDVIYDPVGLIAGGSRFSVGCC